MSLLLALIVALAVTMALVPLLMRWAGALHVLDEPGERKVHDTPIPRIGGIAMCVGVVVSVVAWLSTNDPRVIAYITGAAVILGFGVWDDRVDLPPFAKILGQLLGILAVMLFGGIAIDSFTLVDRHHLPAWIGMPLTVLFILGVTNAINLSDGLDGLAGGTTLLTAAVLALIARIAADITVATMALALVGAILGFLRFNTHPARIFMGDGGSQFVGFTVAVLAVMLTQNEAVAISTATPLMLLGLPVVDTLMVMAQRFREHRPLFSADKRHVHHKLLDLGFDHYEAVLVIYLVQGIFFLAAWVTRYEPDPMILVIFATLATVMVGLLLLAGRLGWRWRRPALKPVTEASALGRGVLWLANPARLPRWSLRVAVVAVLAYLLTVASLANKPTLDVGWLAAVLAVAAILGARYAQVEWLARAAMYTAAATAVYLDHVTTDKTALLQTVKFIALPALAFCVLLRMRLSERRFRITTLDMLLVFVAIVMPSLPGLPGGPGNFTISILKLTVLLYAIELCSDQSERGRRLISAGVLGFGVVAMLRAAT
ncbi:MAG: MraY family glycosyltransferase [Pseudomonadota bacterium]